VAESVVGLGELESEWIRNPSATVCARLADLLRQAGRLDEASELAAGGLRKWPGSASIGIVLGRSLKDSGRLDGAVDAFEAVLAAQPMNLVALRGLGEISFRRRKWRAAVEYLEEYLLEHAADAEALDMLEQARRNADSPDPSEEAEEEEIAREHEREEAPVEPVPDSFPGTERMARVLEAQGIVPPPPAPGTPERSTGHGSDAAIPTDPASLLDLFSEEEREELGLSSFDGDLI